MNKKIIFAFGILFLLVVGGFTVYNFVNVSAIENTVCCEKTTSGAFCQNVPASECDAGFRQVPTSCEATSYCRAGTCYDSTEGTCADNTPQLVCNDNGGVWSEESPPQCELGCCTLGDQASFVSLVRCKKLSANLGLNTNYNQNIKSEVECISSVQGQEKGACVFEKDFEKTCDFITKAECNSKDVDAEFYKDKLCSAEELGTVCGPTKDTLCVPGKDEVYFKDSCGNPANIYDSSKVENQEYWTNVKRKDESCGFGQGNGNSKSCGNCDYLQGSFCRDGKVVGVTPNYGDFICADLNCKDSEGNERRHGESWCANDPKKGDGQDRVGSRSFRDLCINGEIVSEPCADFRNEICIEDSIETDNGKFSQAACRVNRWQDCLAQTSEDDCSNSDRRDCFWNKGITLGNQSVGGTCLAKNAPGLKFWQSEETKSICNQANQVCVVTFEKGLFGGEKCVENCDCLTDKWAEKYSSVCSALGDCGSGTNWAGFEGYKKGYEIKINGKKKK